MEKLTKTSMLWAIMVSCLFFSHTLFGQATQPPNLTIVDNQTDHGGGNQASHTIKSDGTTSVGIKVRVANLAPMDNHDINRRYPLPANAQHFAIKIEIGGETGTIPLDSFQHFGNIGDTVNGHLVFDKHINFEFSLQEECDQSSENRMQVRGTFSLVDENTGALIPIEPFSGADDLFSCEVFSNTCGYCFGDSCLHAPDSVIVQERVFIRFCEQEVNSHEIPPTKEGGGNDGGGNDEGSNNTNGFEKQPIGNLTNGAKLNGASTSQLNVNTLSGKNSTPSLQLHPNPFQQTTLLSYQQQQAGQLTVRIFDNSGQLVGQWTEFVEQGRYEKEIDLSGLTSGLYYGQIISAERSESFRLLKAGQQ